MGEDSAKVVREALDAGRGCDEDFELQEHPGKRELFSTMARGRRQLTPLETAKAPSTSFSLLGVVHEASRRKRGPLKEAARRIKMAALSGMRRRKAVQVLVLRKLLWSAAGTRLPQGKMRRLATEIERCILGRVYTERSRFLIWTCTPELGPKVCPFYNANLEAIRSQRRKLRRRYNEERTAQGHSRDPMHFVEVEWGWRKVEEGQHLTRDGVLDLGADGDATRVWRDWHGWKLASRAT